MPNYLPLFEFTRGQIVESLHYGSVVIMNPQGERVAWYGDPAAVTHLRSSAKPFQILPFLEHGGQTAYQLSAREVAIICASHSGTDEHIQVVRGIQAKTGVAEENLLCGVHNPYHPETLEAMRLRGEQSTPNRNNCSGKHTGMVAHCFLHGWPIADYINPNHPLQQEIMHTLSEMCDLPVEQFKLGIDGCSAPTFALPLHHAALAYARLCDPSGLAAPRAAACRTITAAMTSYPEMIGGPDSFDTHLMQQTGGKIVAKTGAEGYQAFGLMPGAMGLGSPGLGIAFKVSDGDLSGHSRPAGDFLGHVRPAVTLEILRRLGAITARELAALQDYGPTFAVTNWRKLVVGEGRPCFKLQGVNGS